LHSNITKTPKPNRNKDADRKVRVLFAAPLRGSDILPGNSEEQAR
jgi:hypothetical protein